MHKRTFLFLESEIVANAAKLQFTEIERESDGLNFNFKAKSSAFRFVDFVGKRAP